MNCAPGYLAYSASKSENPNTLAKTLSKECKGYNIKINSFSPGHKTKMFPLNPLSTKVCIPYLYKLSKFQKRVLLAIFWFSKKNQNNSQIKINWSSLN